MISNTEATETAQATEAEQPKATKKATAGKRSAHVAPAKGKTTKKASPPKKATPAKAPKGAKEAGKKAAGSRDGSKASTILDLLKRKDGTTLKELMKATGWQAHSVRGFLSGTIGKKMGLALTSTKAEDGERTYSIKA
ncbi:MAG TPA: DUF3489 domain-containing protein [Pirellulales bacterium]|jgi:hypothetical protein